MGTRFTRSASSAGAIPEQTVSTRRHRCLHPLRGGRLRRIGRGVAAGGGTGAGGLLALCLLVGCSALTSDETITTVLPPADAGPGRWVVLDGANNTRDIGGYVTRDGRRVRWKAVYRSGELSRLTPAGCDAFGALGIHRVVDFRNRLVSSPLFGGDAVCVFEAAPVDLLAVNSDDTDPSVPAYVLTVRNNAGSYRGAFELLADPGNLPLLYHCAAGKDRAGIMTALLLTLLGVDRETVMAEYGLSDFVGATTNAQAMTDLLNEVDRTGGIEAYLAGIGVSAATQSAIRAALLE